MNFQQLQEIRSKIGMGFQFGALFDSMTINENILFGFHRLCIVDVSDYGNQLFAKQKLINKNLDVIVANNVTEKGAGFSIDTNKVTIIDNKGNTLKLGIMPKYEVANQIINKIISMMS